MTIGSDGCWRENWLWGTLGTAVTFLSPPGQRVLFFLTTLLYNKSRFVLTLFRRSPLARLGILASRDLYIWYGLFLRRTVPWTTTQSQ